MVRETLPTVAVTVAVPAAAEVSFTEATPLVVVLRTATPPFSMKVPRLVLN
jgi:hypothetical protein